jgi:SSS family solute:Na+ symporter
MAVVAPEEVDGVDVAAEPQLVPTDEELDFFNLWKPNSDPSYPWFGLLFGAPIVGLWYWCTDQYIVQRTLAAKNQTEARRGTIFGAYLKMFPVFLFIIPGMAAYGIAAQGDVRLFPVLEEGGANQAFPLLVKHILPVGVKGVVIGGLLAALMSSLASVFNSCSTLFTIDIYKKIVPSATEKHLVWIGRLATTVMVILGLLWIPVVILLMKGSLYDYLQAVQSYIGPPIAAVFFLGIFCKRVNAAGCMAGLGVGFLLGASRLIAEILSKGTGTAAETIASSPFLNWFATTSFTFMAIWLTVASVAVILAVSLVTPKPPKEKTDRLTWSTRTAEDRAETRASWNRWDLIASVGLILCILTIYIYFTGNMLR